ncbi:hypothetical protein AB0L06_16700 [Spirillospora sp. NPDC052269]
MVAAATDEGELWRWSLDDGRPIGDPIKAHDTGVRAMDAVEVDGRPLAVTAGRGGVVHIWNLTP